MICASHENFKMPHKLISVSNLWVIKTSYGLWIALLFGSSSEQSNFLGKYTKYPKYPGFKPLKYSTT